MDRYSYQGAVQKGDLTFITTVQDHSSNNATKESPSSVGMSAGLFRGNHHLIREHRRSAACP